MARLVRCLEMSMVENSLGVPGVYHIVLLIFVYGQKSISRVSLLSLLASICRAHQCLVTNRNIFVELNEGLDLDGPENR
jgi:hypothetical protein